MAEPHRIQRARYVRSGASTDHFPPGFSDGVYLVAAEVDSPSVQNAVLTWAVARPVLSRGRGLIVRMDSMTHAFSSSGLDTDPESIGLDVAIDGYDAARRCVSG